MTETDVLQRAIDAVSGGRAAPIRLKDGRASVILDVTGLDEAARQTLEHAVRERLSSEQGISEVRVALTSMRTAQRLIAVGSGKGGVGKSTLSANLAIALRRLGFATGLIDADIHGPSQPRIMATEDARPEAEDQKLIPVATRFGVPMLSLGHLVKPGQAVAWRGPMAGNALGQLIDAHWGDATTLIVDLPPGTGDVQLSMIQKHKPAGAVIVSTPQDLALIDAARAIDFFNKAGVPIIGMVENMAGYQCPHCGEVSDPFGAGGAEKAAAAMGLAFLGRVPLDAAIMRASDAGEPPAAGNGPQAQAFLDIAGKVAGWLNAA